MTNDMLDTSQWPLVVLSAEGRMDAAAAADLTAALDDLLDRAEADGTQLAMVIDIERLARDASAAISGWMLERMERLARLVRATATVVPPATVARNRELMAEHAGSYPFRTWVAGTIEECRAWLLQPST